MSDSNVLEKFVEPNKSLKCGVTLNFKAIIYRDF